MKMRLADYVSDFLVKVGITDVFCVTGGGAMHLDDAICHDSRLKVTYMHHEQSCAIAAEAYARINNKPACVLVTTGPGGTNALTGVLCAYLDSVPMLVISGQVKYETTSRKMNCGVRAAGDQEFDITKCAAHMTKYAVMTENPADIRFELEKAYCLATEARCGPTWIDIPLDFQSSIIETDALVEYFHTPHLKSVSKYMAEYVCEEISKSRRPILYAGNGVRLSGGYDEFLKVAEKLQIPVVLGWNSIDLLPNENELYAGRAGIMGDRAGNFAVQNADLIIAVGNRLSIRQVGYNYKTWARDARVIMVDADNAEMEKPTLHVDKKINADAKDFFEKLFICMDEVQLPDFKKWRTVCRNWVEKYKVTTKKHYEDMDKTNVYAFIDTISKMRSENSITVVGNGSACVVGSHAFNIKKGERFIINSAVASMGYDLPAAIGACIAGKDEIICITGEGSLQMNIQELQTIVTNELPIKIFVINNGGYHSIRQTQRNFYPEKKLVGIGAESKDLGFPDLSKIACAYGYKYFSCRSNEELQSTLETALSTRGRLIFEVFVGESQNFEPKSSSKQLDDGTIVSPPLEDMFPFLPREELKENMEICKWCT